MPRFRITYLVEVEENDPAMVLDAAHSAAPALVQHLRAECRTGNVLIDNDETSAELLHRSPYARNV